MTGQPKWTDEEMASVAEMLKSGLPLDQIADKFRMTKASLASRIRRNERLSKLYTPPPRRPEWNDEDRRRVGQMLKKGWSAGRIGKELGLSRCAVIGRIFRDPQLKLQAPVTKAIPGMASRPRKRLVKKPPPPKIPPAPPIKTPPAPVVALPRPPFRCVPLKDLGRRDCHWPVSPHGAAPDEHLFCGAGTRRGERFCPYHCLIAFQPRVARYG